MWYVCVCMHTGMYIAFIHDVAARGQCVALSPYLLRYSNSLNLMLTDWDNQRLPGQSGPEILMSQSCPPLPWF